jgi:hypothetical protein
MDKTLLESEQEEVVRGIAQDASPEQQRALLEWAKELLAIRESDESVRAKARAAVAATASREVVWPIVRVMFHRLKRLGWDERGWATRLGLGAVAVTLAVFGPQGAGLAVFGTAIAVPLWFVFGAGGAFAGMLIDELEKALEGHAKMSRSAREASHGTEPGPSE